METGQDESDNNFNVMAIGKDIPDVGNKIPDAKDLENVRLSRLGPVGIIREARKLLRKHPACAWIHLTLMGPLVILAVVGGFMFYQNFSFNQATVEYQGVITVLVISVVVVVGDAATNVASSAILYTVGLHYTGRSISFLGVIRASIPRLWLRLTVTTMCKILILFSTIFLGYFLWSLVLALVHHRMHVSPIVFMMVFRFSSYSLEIIFTVADSVSVLGGDYGWAAVRKSLQLLKGRKAVAVGLLLIWLVPTILSNYFAVEIVVANDCLSNWDLQQTLYLALSVFFITTVWFLKKLCSVIQYVSFKAYHNEDLEESIYPRGTELNFGRMRSAIGNAEVGGQLASFTKVGGQPSDTEV